MAISNLYHIDYNLTTKKITVNEGLYQSDSIKSERKNPFGQPIFDLEDNQWCSITERKNDYQLFLKFEDSFYKASTMKTEGKNIITFDDFKEVKKINGKWEVISEL